MVKKGNILTQLALISDLFEKANMDANKTEVVFSFKRDEFDRLFKIFSEKANTPLISTNDAFNVKIGLVKFIFMVNKSSV